MTGGRPILLVPERLFDGSGAPTVTGMAVLIGVDGRIGAVDRAGSFDGVDAEHVTHPGATLLPGLIDGHVHLEMTPTADHAPTLAAWEQDSAAGLLPLRAARHAMAALAAGHTTIRDCGSSRAILSVREGLAAMGAGPRLLVTGPPITTPRGHCHWFGGEAGTLGEVRALVAELCERGVDAVKLMATGGVMTAGSDPGARQFRRPTVRAVVEEAHRRGRAVVVHANATGGIADALATGADVIDHLGWLDRSSAVRPDGRLIAALGRARQICGMTTSGIVRRELTAGAEGRSRLQARFADKAALHAAGARLHLHSDAGVRLTTFDRPDLGLATAAAGTGLPLSVLLGMMTSGAAAAVGRPDLGAIRAGAPADLLVVDGDPTVDAEALRRVRAVRRDGRLLVTAAADGSTTVAVAA
jgi:imidazolonepropionase-like amidohydrolase